MKPSLLQLTDAGLYCSAGDFFIDPWRPVERAIITHAHADHMRWGSRHYLVAEAGETVCRSRLGDDADIETMGYGESRSVGRAKVSLHPAGHVLGSAQVRVEVQGEVWVVSGDYKTSGDDPTCTPFEPIQCHTFVTESTFGLPIYRWQPAASVWAEVNQWWRENAAQGRASIIYAYSLGKAQRVLAGVDAEIGPIYTHGAVEKLTEAYRRAGVSLPPTQYACVYDTDSDGKKRKGKRDWAGSLIVAPPSAHGSTWVRKFAPYSTAICSGWMRVRGTRRRRAVDRGFVLSDHADWPGLLQAVGASGAERVLATHGYTAVLCRWLESQGLDAEILETRFEGEQGGEADEPSV